MEQSNYKRLYESLKSEWERHKPVWDIISQYVGITTQSDYSYGTDDKSQRLDEYIDDPTASLSVTQSGDYMVGLLWGGGDDAVKVVPSNYVTELADDSELNSWYEYATKRVLYHINHDQSGFINALRPYAYDQQAFGTSGIGCFKNKHYINGMTDCLLSFKMYGVDNTVIGEGANSLIDYIFVKHWWDVLRIVEEFDGIRLPDSIQTAINAKNFGKRFPIVFAMMPNNEFQAGKIGKKGAKFKGVWFLDEGDCQPFFTEYFNEKPIAICRQMKMRNETYGRSGGTLLISTIRAVNYMIGNAIEIIEKMNLPALGTFNNALFGDGVLDDSSGSLSIFNPQQIGSQNPIFPLYTVGDPSALVNFLLPYLNEKIVTAFKVDQLLDFNASANMSATESMHRYTIRGQSLFGTLVQQKTETMIPTLRRAVTLCYDNNELGVDPRNEDAVSLIRKVGRGERIIPEAVIQIRDGGKSWFNLQFNTEMEKLTRTDAVDDLLKMLNSVSAVATLYPAIIDAVDWYRMIKDINEKVTPNAQILLGEEEFKDVLKAKAEQVKQQQQLQQAEQQSKAMFNVAQASAVTEGSR